MNDHDIDVPDRVAAGTGRRLHSTRAQSGCVTYGETLEEAERMAQDAIQGCLAVMKEEGEEIIDDSRSLEKHIQVAVV